MESKTHALEVWGDLACFTRPELKVERFSYPVITPSAARAIFEAVYWKKTFRWQVEKIEVLKPPRYIALRRNEVKDKVPAGSVASWMAGKKEPVPIFADGDKGFFGGDDQKGRTQRQTMALKDVKYRLHARAVPWPTHDDELVDICSQFERRAGHGKCFYQPYLGCREFPAFFRLVRPGDDLPAPYDLDLDLGLMLYDVFDLSKPGDWNSPPAVSLFHAQVSGGVLEVPGYSSDSVLKIAEEVDV
jgi:CRISPR-associated protein Cas5d